METRTTRFADGTVDIVQRGPASWEPSAEELQRLYWSEVARASLGLIRFSGDAVRVLGLWPALLRFGPLTDGGRLIVGGLFARTPHGAIRWSAAGAEVTVTVERFAPLLRGPFWRFETWFHDLIGRRFLSRASRPAA